MLAHNSELYQGRRKIEKDGTLKYLCQLDCELFLTPGIVSHFI
jgi:hypothetical protein